MTATHPALIALAFASMCLVWGSTWIMIKIGVTAAPPLTVLALRFAIATAVVFALVRAMRLPIPRTRHFLVLSLFLGVVHQAAGYVLVYWAEQYITSGLTAVLFSTMPFAVALIARWMLRDAITLRKAGGAVSGAAGVSLIYADSLATAGTVAALGVALTLLGVFCASLSSVVVKKYANEYHPFVMLLCSIFVGAVIVSILAAAFEHSNPLAYDRATWGSIVYLAIFGSAAGFALFYWVVKRVDVTIVSYQTFIIPVIALVLGGLFLGEALSSRMAAGAALILAGILVATLRTGRRRSPA
jgi:drug/metabolite transporter (DMT)-like permease